jgi:hypothetical protein
VHATLQEWDACWPRLTIGGVAWRATRLHEALVWRTVQRMLGAPLLAVTTAKKPLARRYWLHNCADTKAGTDGT